MLTARDLTSARVVEFPRNLAPQAGFEPSRGESRTTA